MDTKISFTLNGKARTITTDPDRRLLEVLREEMQFENGVITNASFRKDRVPRFDDLPEPDVHLLDRPDLPSVGAGETPIIAIAPAVANAVFRATGKSVCTLTVNFTPA